MMASPQQLHGDEPPMFLQRPSSARSQDISHILARTFREFFTRDAVPPETVKYLNTSRGGDDDYHETYVEALRKVQEERDRRMKDASMLETHIMQAQARAMTADERELNRVSSRTSSFPDLGLPPSRSHYRSCIDGTLLRKHNLITPDDYNSHEAPLVPPPPDPMVPSYARDTMSSAKRNEDGVWESPFPSPRDSMLSGHIPSEGGESLSSLEERLPPIHDDKLTGVWRQQFGAEEREYNRKDLANQQAKVNYLKNPRHIPPSASGAPQALTKQHKHKPKEVGIKPAVEKESAKEPAVVFLPSPPVLTFKHYGIGTVYEMPLELKNITSVLRPVRVVPPKTQYFSISLGQFPGDQGLVAPGMSCKYMIRFSPDGLGDFDDLLTVQSQASTPLVVKLEGRRPPPKLTLPTRIDVGQCLVGGVKIGQFHVKNEGGMGRFCLMNRESWPTTSLKSVAHLGTVLLTPFEVRPPVFELGTGERMVLEVLFAPTEVTTYEATLTSVCDNCHVKHFTLTGEGQSAAVELVSVEGGTSQPLPGELCDLTAQHLIRFENLNPFTYLQKSVIVRNITNVELPFDWIIVKPYIKPRDPESVTSPLPPTERVQDIDSVFTIEPESGSLQPGASSTFTLTFAPAFVHDFHNALHLVLRNIPHVAPPPTPAPEGQGRTGLELNESHREGSLSREGRNMSRQGSNMSRQGSVLGHEGTAMSRQGTLLSRQGSSRPEPHIPKAPQLEDVTALEFEVKGVCEALSVVLQPYALTIPGKTMVETLLKRPFKMINNSLSAILFQWDHHSSGYILEVEPPIGELGPECEMDLELSLSGSEPCKIDHTLSCQVHHLEEPLMLHVDAEIKGPEITIEEADVNFGLVRLGDVVTSTVTLRNECRVSAAWNIRESPTHIGSELDILEGSEFRFRPESGELRPLECISVTVTFTPRCCKSVRTVFEVQVEDSSDSSILVSGEVQSPQACLLSCEVFIDNVYLDVPICHQVSLLNQTLLATTFEWGELEGKDADKCSVTLEPANGSLDPRQQLDVNLFFTAHKTEELTDLRITCRVAGMEQPLYLSLCTDVKGLSVTYATPSTDAKPDAASTGADTAQATSLPAGSPALDDASSLCLDFGADVLLGQAVSRMLVISNNSAITAPFSLTVQHFTAKPPTPPGNKTHMPNKSSQRRALLNRTPNLADPLSKAPARAHADLCKTMLREGKGTAFALSPASGVLEPFCDQVVEVTAFSDMWGEYNDNVICKVEKLEVVEIPIRMTVRGCPLLFQMMAAQPHQQAILRCGTHVSGVVPVVRPMRINNPAPVDIRMDWQVFNVMERDTQLLDMILSYDQAFPLRDDDGNEIQPPQDAPPVYQRPPTAYIPNSPDSTPAMSRQETRMENHTPVPLAQTRPKVIHLTLREHGGKMAAEPYKIEPPQMVIPARGSSNINVRFTPLASSDVTQEMNCNGYALGYMSLTDKVASTSGKVERRYGYDVKPLRLEMTAQVKPALLTIECSDDEGMSYRAAASDLLLDGQIQSECLKLSHTTLTNNTKTGLVFRLQTAEPFYIVQLDPQDMTPVAQMTATDMTTLRPRENALVHVGFRLTPDLLKYADSEDEVKGVEVEVREEERRIHFKHDLTLEFNNNSTQRVPLCATLVLPSVVLSKELIDFGVCLVGQRRELQIILSNPTCSASLWKCVIERRSEACDGETFEITPSSGSLEAHVTHVSNSKVLLQVYFTAKHSECYESVYAFHGMLGEPTLRLTIQGEGSYDGKHEALVNI